MERVYSTASFSRVESYRGELKCTVLKVQGHDANILVWKGDQRRLYAKYPDWRTETMHTISGLVKEKVEAFLATLPPQQAGSDGAKSADAAGQGEKEEAKLD